MDPDEEPVAILRDALFACTHHPESPALAAALIEMLGKVGWYLVFDPVKQRAHFDEIVAATPIGSPDPSVVTREPQRLPDG